MKKEVNSLMKPENYLRQAYRLDLKINSDIEEAQRLRAMADSISSPSWGEKVQSTRSGEPAFVRCIMKITKLEEKINQEIDTLVDLKQQMRNVIAGVEDPDEQMVLRYRYIHNMTWEQIGDELNADASTVRRWHSKAILHVTLPEDPIVIENHN